MSHFYAEPELQPESTQQLSRYLKFQNNGWAYKELNADILHVHIVLF